MNKVEFMNRVKRIDTTFAVLEPSDEDYKVIEYVYNWHPSVDNVRGKEQIAYLYCEFGMRIIRDMLLTAQNAEEYEKQMNKATAEYNAAKDRYDRLKAGTL